jgi:hypothetical protein
MDLIPQAYKDKKERFITEGLSNDPLKYVDFLLPRIRSKHHKFSCCRA